MVLPSKNQGGLVMPLVLQFTLEDGTEEVKRIAAEVWLKNEEIFYQVVPTSESSSNHSRSIPRNGRYRRNNNYCWPTMAEPSKFDVYSKGATSRWQSNGRSNL